MALIVPATPPAPAPVLFPFRDRVFRAPARNGGARAHAALAGRRYKLPNGSSIVVSVAASFHATRAQTQAFADRFFGKLRHGSEMSRLHVRIETQAGVTLDCGDPNVLACYEVGANVMVVPGDATPTGQFPQDYVIAHEYGHHIAVHRSNDPWDAGEFGTKRWATVEGVCAGVYGTPQRFFPGNEKEHYRANPGEDFAESYAVSQFPSYASFWQFSARLKPTLASTAALVKDVTTPWHQRLLRFTRTLGPGHRLATIELTTPLDGRIGVRVTPARGLRTRVRIRTAGGRSVASGATLARRTVCGHRQLTVRIARLAGHGTARILVTQP